MVRQKTKRAVHSRTARSMAPSGSRVAIAASVRSHGAGSAWQEEPHPPARLARSHFASIEGLHPFEMPSQMVDVFEHGSRRQALGSGDPPGALFRVTEYIALLHRSSWLRPCSGHPSSSFGFQALPPISGSITWKRDSLPLFHERPAGALRALTLNQIGEPSKPNAARIWFSRKRSKEKCNWMSRSVKRMNVGGATAACVM